MFRKFLLLFVLVSVCFGQDLPSVPGYVDAQEGVCEGINPDTLAQEEPNYLELWFQEHPQNCTSVCDDLPTCSGISYTPSRFKLQCRIYVFYDIQQEVEVFPNDYLPVQYFWIPTGDDGSFHATTVGGNGGRYCYIRITEAPSTSPSTSPSTEPSVGPSVMPTTSPSQSPTVQPTYFPSTLPSVRPTVGPTTDPTVAPSVGPSMNPTSDSPSTSPTNFPTSDSPSTSPSVNPTVDPSVSPTQQPTTDSPTVGPTAFPTFEEPSVSPTFEEPTVSPTLSPSTDQPTVDPTKAPTFEEPTVAPTQFPTSDMPSQAPTSDQPTVMPTLSPSSDQPTTGPTAFPTFEEPSVSPTSAPSSDSPSSSPTTEQPTQSPSVSPSVDPTVQPTFGPSISPETSIPSVSPTTAPSKQPQTPLPSVTPTTSPSFMPSTTPSRNPTGPPSTFPSGFPSTTPSRNPTGPPSTFPSDAPSFPPSVIPTAGPSKSPTSNPTTDEPSVAPSGFPTSDQPSKNPTTDQPTTGPTAFPTSDSPSTSPSVSPSVDPTVQPSLAPTSDSPSTSPTNFPTTDQPSVDPTVSPSTSPSVDPTVTPSTSPSVDPTAAPSTDPTVMPSTSPSREPTTDTPSVSPTVDPTKCPTSDSPSVSPTVNPSIHPTQDEPSVSPTMFPTSDSPSVSPTADPSKSPTTEEPSTSPSVQPTGSPTTDQPTTAPTVAPSGSPTVIPSDVPSVDPTTAPSFGPSVDPTVSPSYRPTVQPSNLPSLTPSITTPCSNGKLNVLGSHFIYLDEEDSFVDEDDLVYLALGIPDRYQIEKVWPSDADTETGYYTDGGTNEFWSLSEDTKQDCTQRITGGFPWARIRTHELMGLTTVTDPTYYEEVDEGTYFHNILTLELSENYTSPDGWAKPGEEDYIERKVIYEIPWLILLETQITLNVTFSVVIPTPGPSTSPSVVPSSSPTVMPTVGPTVDPTRAPSSEDPTVSPSVDPSVNPTVCPTVNPSVSPSVDPTKGPSFQPSVVPSFSPSVNPSAAPSVSPSVVPTSNPSASPTPREYFYYNLTLRADDIWKIGDFLTEYPSFDPTQRFEVIEDVPHGGFTFFGNPAHQTDITPDEIGNFEWTGANVTSDTFMTWMAESANIRVRFDILLSSPLDCTAHFTEWSSCSTTCGTGIETRTWVVTDFADAAGNCDYWDGFVDVRECYIEVCPLIDEIVTRFAVYNPDLDENSTVCMNFTTITNLPWKTVEDGFSIVDPNNILNEDSASFSFNPVEGCWPTWSYDEFDGLCGELLSTGAVKHPTGMFIQISNLEDPICKEVCDYFAEDCIGYDILPELGFQPAICEVLGPDLTPAHAREANQFVDDGRTFDYYFDEATQITGGYTFAQVGAKCYRKGDPIYTGNCLQDYNMCFTMDFVCNLDEVFYLEVTAENLITGTVVTQEFETRIATDASCAQIIGDVKLSGTLEAFHNETRTQSVIQFYKGSTIYFTVNIDSYANVDSISLAEMRYTQDASDGAESFEYPIAHSSAMVTDASTVVPATQTFSTEGRFSMIVTDPIQGSVDGVYTKFIGTFQVLFIDGRRQLVEGEFTRSVRSEINMLIYPPKCSNPEADPGDTVKQTCDEGRRIIWCDENGQWVLLVNECGDDVPVNFHQSTAAPEMTRIIRTSEDDAFIWRTSAIAIGVSLLCACCVYYLLVCRRKKREKQAVFFEDKPVTSTAGGLTQDEDESSEIGSEYGTPREIPIKRTPMGTLMDPSSSHSHSQFESSESYELGPDFNTNIGKDINSDIDQDMKAATQVFNDLGLQDLQMQNERHITPSTPV